MEDEFLLALDLEDELRAAGASVVGPFSDLARATQAARDESFDVALLDVNLNGVMVYPLADELVPRGVGVIFLTGYAALSLPDRFRSSPIIAKPYDSPALIAEIHKLIAGRRG